MSPLGRQISDTLRHHREKQHLVVMDNNSLGIPEIADIIAEIRSLGFQAGAQRNGRATKLLATICVSPIRLADL
jgi:hypothetical protein